MLIKKLEKQIENSLKRKIDNLGGLCLKWFSTFFTGMPDRIILMPGGKIWFVETKTAEGSLSERQKYVHKQLRKLGFRVWVVITNGDLEKLIKDIEYDIRTA